MSNKTIYMGTIPLDLIKLPEGVANWETYQTEDIFATNLISYPNNYMFTLGSGIDTSYKNIYASLATTPSYDLASGTKFYIAGRDIVRWGGRDDPNEIDFDRYVFVPDTDINIAKVYKAPKSEPHHLSEIPSYVNNIPTDWEELCEAIRKGELGK